MQQTRLAVLLSLTLAVSSLALAQEPTAAPVPTGNAKRGAVLSDTCMGCHGIDGYRNAYPSFHVPKLGGQHPEYVVIALQGYKNQTRFHKTMHAQAASLSDQDMREIAAFFATEGGIKNVAVVSMPRRRTLRAPCTSMTSTRSSPASSRARVSARPLP
jgi:cytochrome c553